MRAQEFLRTPGICNRWRDAIAAHKWLVAASTWADQQLDLSEIARQAAAAVACSVVPVVAHSVGAVSQAGVTLLALFFFLRDKQKLLAGIRSLPPGNPQPASFDLLHSPYSGVWSIPRRYRSRASGRRDLRIDGIAGVRVLGRSDELYFDAASPRSVCGVGAGVAYCCRTGALGSSRNYCSVGPGCHSPC
jgi:hypothetical protein